MSQCEKLGLGLYLEGVDTLLRMDTEKIDDNLVIFGFEEHVFGDGSRAFKTEQVLDKEDLILLRNLIDSSLELLL